MLFAIASINSCYKGNGNNIPHVVLVLIILCYVYSYIVFIIIMPYYDMCFNTSQYRLNCDL